MSKNDSRLIWMAWSSLSSHSHGQIAHTLHDANSFLGFLAEERQRCSVAKNQQHNSVISAQDSLRPRPEIHAQIYAASDNICFSDMLLFQSRKRCDSRLTPAFPTQTTQMSLYLTPGQMSDLLKSPPHSVESRRNPF